MNALDVSCPTCAATEGDECHDDLFHEVIAPHAGRVRIARALAASESLGFRRIAAQSYEVHNSDGSVLGSVWRDRRGWSSRLTDGTVVTRGWPGTLAIAGGLLTVPLEPIPAPDNMETKR